MADPALDPSDPLAGWQPGSGSPVATATVSPDDPLAATPKKSVLDTSYHTLPSDTRQGQTADDAPAFGGSGWFRSRDPVPAGGNITEMRQTATGAYEGTPASETPGLGGRSVLSPATQKELNTHWYGPPINVAGNVVGTALADASAFGSGMADLGMRALQGLGVPDAAIRDINLEATRRAGEGSGVPDLIPRRGPYVNPRDVPGMTAATEPVARTPTPIELAQAQEAARKAALRANAQPDATTDATIALLRRTNPNAAAAVPDPTVIPTPPAGWTPRPQAAPTGGLLAMPPTAQAGPTDLLGGRPGPTPAAAATMTADEIKARAEGYYSPADKAAAQGAMLPQDNANAVRSAVTDIMPSDPEKAQYFASTNPTVASAAKDVSQFTGKLMSYDSAMQLDRRLTADIRATRDPNEQRLLGQMQDGVRDQMDQVPDLQGQGAARQAYTQYIKQSQMEDINYNASLKNDPAQQAASVRQQAATMLKNDSKMRNWTDDERAQLEQVAKSGDIGALGRLAVGMVRPAWRAGLGGLGSLVAGTPGAFVGSEIGGDIGASQAARLRAYLSQTTLDPVMAQISRGVPPIPAPPTGPPRARMAGD